MLLQNEYAGYKRLNLTELKEKKYINTYEDGDDIKPLNNKKKLYVDVLIRLCNWLTSNAKYEISYKDWLITSDGINLIPQAIVFNDKQDKIIMDVELFEGIVMEGIISEQVKEIKKGMIDIKKLIKNNSLDNVISIKPVVNYWHDDNHKPELAIKDDPVNYFSKKVPVARLYITKSKITDDVMGFITLMGNENHIFDNIETNIYDFATICEVK